MLAANRRTVRIAPLAILALALVAFLPPSAAGAAQAAIGLGAGTSFAVLAGAGITNTGPTTINGDIGSHPTPSVPFGGAITLNGVDHGTDAVTAQAKTDLVTAYNEAAGSAPTTAVAVELGGTSLTPGSYGGGTLEITGTLTLNMLGDPNAVFIFKAASTLVTQSNSAVTIVNGGNGCNVFWQVGSSATLGTNSHMIGTIMAATAITATTGATIDGRLMAQTAAVTLDSNVISRQTCAAAVVPPPTTTTTSTTSTTSTTAVPGSTSTTAVPAGPTASTTTTTGASATTTSAPGSRTPGDSSTRSSLPATGSDPRLPLIAVSTIAVGVLLVGVSSRRRRQSSP